MQNLLARLIPFIFLGIMLVLLVIGIIALSYLLIVGAIVGLFLFVIAWIKEKFFNKKSTHTEQLKQRTGRTIDHHDI